MLPEGSWKSKNRFLLPRCPQSQGGRQGGRPRVKSLRGSKGNYLCGVWGPELSLGVILM